MDTVFVDTGTIFAVKTDADGHHEAAAQFFNQAVQYNLCSFITTDFIIFETVTLMKARLSNSIAIEAGKFLRANEHIKTIKVTEDTIKKAWDIFDRFDDKSFSFTDCTSFAIMKERGITKAFTFDEHFSQFGLEVVPG